MLVSQEEEKRICESVTASTRTARANLTESDFDDISQSVVTVIVSRLCKQSSPPTSFAKYVNRTAKCEVIKALKHHRASRKTELPLPPNTPASSVLLAGSELISAIQEELPTLTQSERDALLCFVGEFDARPNYRLKDIAIRKLRTQLSKRGLL